MSDSPPKSQSLPKNISALSQVHIRSVRAKGCRSWLLVEGLIISSLSPSSPHTQQWHHLRERAFDGDLYLDPLV